MDSFEVDRMRTETRSGDEQIRTHEDLDWFRPPECKPYIHFSLYCSWECECYNT
jgi:hypothetical protein